MLDRPYADLFAWLEGHAERPSADAPGRFRPVMLAVAGACLPIFFTGHLIARWEGWLFFGYYVAYTQFLVLASQQHDALLMGYQSTRFKLPSEVGGKLAVHRGVLRRLRVVEDHRHLAPGDATVRRRIELLEIGL